MSESAQTLDSSEASAVREVVEDPRDWPLDRYREEAPIDWLRLAQVWMAVLLGFIEVVLAFRLGFLMAAANPENGFVNMIYDITGPLAAPFEGILGATKIGADGAFDPSILVAMLVYMVASILITSVAWALAATAAERHDATHATLTRTLRS